jgi:anti-sigma regulatory factor (Ser/Thr protein kinase)/PAS domain-containing protein
MPSLAARAQWELPAEPASVGIVRGHVRRFAQEHGARGEDVVDVTLAVTEAVTNSVIHAFVGRAPGTVWVLATTAADELTVTVTDDGRGMQPRADSPGLGLGLPTIGRLAAFVDLREPVGGGTELSMTFATPGVRGPARVVRETVRASELLESVSRTVAGAWPGEGVQGLVDLLVPELADACAVDVLDGAGYPERFAGRVDGPDELSAWLAGLRPRADAARSATRAALADGEPHVSELTLDLIERITSNAADAGTMAATGIRWWVVIPLREGERLLGLLHFGLRPARGRPAPELVELLAAVGRRAAAALANSQLVAELARTRDRFERILDVLGEAVTVRDASGRMVYANEAAAHLLGAASVRELLETGAAELRARFRASHPDGTPVDADEFPSNRLLAGLDAPPLLTRTLDVRTGEERWLLTKATVLDEGERLIVTIIDDVSGAR